MNFSDVITLDYESEGIRNRPEYPPKPVGCAVKVGRSRSYYLAWAHPTENNCTKREAMRELKGLYHSKTPKIFHNASFDVDVGMTHLGWNDIDWQLIHDTLFLAFLHDPRDESLSLKPWCEKYLGVPPDERDQVKEWILKNVPGTHDHKGKKVKHPELYWAANICLAPGKLVGKYARGDVDRTYKMFKKLYPIVTNKMGMMDSYNAERINLLRFNRMSEEGIKIRRSMLGKDLKHYELEFEKLEKKIYRKCGGTFDIGSGPQLAEMLDKKGLVDGWEYTDKGNKSTSRENVMKHIADPKLGELLAHRGVLNTYLTTFMRPWYEKSNQTGFIYPTYNQVRSRAGNGDESVGTRTGRPSSSNPNLLNVPKNAFDPDVKWTKQLPNMRNYLAPDSGCVFLNRDYSQQEIRILGHYEGSTLLEAYLEDPALDVHKLAQELILELTGVLYPRKYIKGTAFGILYGMGLKLLAQRLKVEYEEARTIKNAYLNAFPGIKDLIADIKAIVTGGHDFIRTWGGRVYYVEDPKILKNGRRQTFEYKMLNYLIQGSAADITKQAMHQIDDACSKSRLVTQVYDEIMICCPKEYAKTEMANMREAMNDIKLDIPMLSDGKISSVSWGQMRTCA